MINQGPRSDESRPIPSRRTHAQKELVNNFRASLAKEFPVKDSSDMERLISSLSQLIQSNNSLCSAVVEGHRASGKVLNRAQLRSEVEMKYMEALLQYNKEELLLLLTAVLSDNTLKNFF